MKSAREKVRTFRAKISGLAFIFCLFALVQSACAAPTVSFGVPPYKNPAQLIEDFSPLIKYLKQETGMDIQFRSAKNGAETVKALVDGGIDVAYLMPALYVNANQRSQGKVQILRSVLNNGQPFFKGVIVTQDGSPVVSLQDLHGKKFAFGFRESTLTFYIPAYLLIQAGLMDSIEYQHVGKPENIALAVQKGFFDAGAIPPNLISLQAGKGLKIIQESEPIRNALFVTSPNLDPTVQKKFEDAFSKLTDLTILKSIGKEISGLAQSTPSDYDNLKNIIEVVNDKFPR